MSAWQPHPTIFLVASVLPHALCKTALVDVADPDAQPPGPDCLIHARYDAAEPFFSQSTEDSALLRVLACVGHGTREFFEFGSQDAMEVNTRLLREEHGWRGHYLDAGAPNARINLHQTFFNSSNIVGLMHKYGASRNLDLLSVDCDFDDLFLLREILLSGFAPRLLLTEYNSNFMLNQAYTVVAPRTLDDPRWQGDCYAGASALAITRLASVFGYALVHSEFPNLLFVRVGTANELGLNLPVAASVLPSVPSKQSARRRSSAATAGSTHGGSRRCNECGATWVKVPPTAVLRPLAKSRKLSPDSFAASLPTASLAYRRVYKRFHLTGREQFSVVYREVSKPFEGAECTSWRRGVVAKPNQNTGRPDSARPTEVLNGRGPNVHAG